MPLLYFNTLYAAIYGAYNQAGQNSTATDPFWDSVGFLLQMDGMNESTSFIDSAKSRSISALGNTKILNDAAKFGTGAAYFDGAGDYLLVPYSADLDTSQLTYTIELWFKATAWGGTLISKDTSGSNFDFSLALINNTSIRSITNSTVNSVTFTVPAMSLNTWYHLAYVRNNGTFTLYLNGVACGTSVLGYTNLSQSYFTIGCSSWNAPSAFFTGFIDDVRFTSGIARYISNFTAPIEGLPSRGYTVAGSAYDPYWHNVVLLSHMEGSSEGTNFTDIFGHSMVASGSAVTSTTRAKFGATSGYFGSSSNSVVTIGSNDDFNLTANDFTVEAWVYSTGASGVRQLVIGARTVASANDWALAVNNNTLEFSWNTGNTISLTASSGLPLNAWNHVAVSRKGTVFSIYMNGSRVGTTTSAVTPTFTNGVPVSIGADSTGTNEQFYGYIDEIRITNGVARYTTTTYITPTIAFIDFAPPIFEPTWKNVSLLLSANAGSGSNNVISDNSSYGAAITRTGNVASSTGITPFTQADGYWSTNFPVGNAGASNAVIASQNALTITTNGSYTVEAFIRLTTNASYSMICSVGNVASTRVWSLDVSSLGLRFYWSTNGASSGDSVINQPYTFNLATWYHIAMVKTGTSVKFFVNGKQVGTSANVTVIYNAANLPFRIGTFMDYVGGFSFIGDIHGLKLSNSAKYSTNFDIATSQLTVEADTQLLTCVGSRLSDKSANAFAITSTSDVITFPYSPFTPLLATDKSNGSIYFNGAGDKLSLAASAKWNFGSTYTFEFWLKPSLMPVSTRCRLILAGTNNTDSALSLEFDSTGVAYLNIPFAGKTAASSPVGFIEGGKWNHYAISVNNGSVLFFKNGVQQGTVKTVSTQTASSSNGLIIGFDTTAGFNFNFAGNICNLRLTNGAARYSSNFSVPTTIDANSYAETVLLINDNEGKIFDSSSRNNVITIGSNVTVDNAVKKFGTGALKFPGTPGHYLSIPHSSDMHLNSADFTWEAWVYRNAVVDATYADCLFSSSSNAHGISIGVNPDGKVSLGVSSSAGAWDIRKGMDPGDPRGSYVIPLKTWVHIAFVRSGGNYACYVNGILDQSFTGSATAVLSNPPATSSWYVGKVSDGLNRNWNGYIDDLRITKGLARYQANFAPPDRTLYDAQTLDVTESYDELWNYVTFAGTMDDFVDAKGVGFGKIGSPIFSSNNAKFGTSLELNGTSAVFTSVVPAPSAKQNFTIELWARNGVISGTTSPALVSTRNATSNSGFSLKALLATNQVSMTIYTTNADTGAVVLTGACNWADNNWHHIAITKNANDVLMFVDGVLVANVQTTLSVYKSGGYMFIGCQNTGAGVIDATSFFTGNIDDVRITRGIPRYVGNFQVPTSPIRIK